MQLKPPRGLFALLTQSGCSIYKINSIMKKSLLLFITLIIASCSSESHGLSFNETAYNTNQDLWNESSVLNYTFSQEYFSSSFGGQPKITSVIKNNELDTIFIQDNNNYDFDIENLMHYDKITDVYSFIDYIVDSCKEQINSSESPMEGAKIDVTYHDSLHYPTEINCSGYYPSGYHGGLDITIIINDFEVIE